MHIFGIIILIHSVEMRNNKPIPNNSFSFTFVYLSSIFIIPNSKEVNCLAFHYFMLWSLIFFFEASEFSTWTTHFGVFVPPAHLVGLALFSTLCIDKDDSDVEIEVSCSLSTLILKSIRV